jgi:hypothetical protein
MKKIVIFLSLLGLFAFGCKRETVFDENEAINNQVKKYVYEYMLLSIDSRHNYALSFKKKIKSDTIEFIVYAHSSISTFMHDSVYFKAKYLNTYVFSNFRSSSFCDSCSVKQAAQYLDKEEYPYFLKENKVPPPFFLGGPMQLKLVFVNNRLYHKELYY